MSASKITIVCCLLIACSAAASAPDLPDGELDGWHSWRVDVVDEAPDLCCFTWNQGVAMRKSCNLDGRHGGFSSSGDSPFPSDEVQIYALMSAGAATKIRVLSSQCPVTSDSPITDLGTVATGDSINWLQRYISPHTVVSDEAITAVAMHAGDAARRLLVDTAKTDSSEDNRETAIFWMAQARIKETAADLRKLMFDDPSADIRQHAAFAYSQSTAVDRTAMLIRQGKEDRDAKVRSQAWFWLAQSAAEESEREIRAALTSERNAEVREQAVFALSQLPADRAVKALAGILENPQLGMDIREQALFWLAQMESEEAFAYVKQLLE
jgi:hypothetical protein